MELDGNLCVRALDGVRYLIVGVLYLVIGLWLLRILPLTVFCGDTTLNPGEIISFCAATIYSLPTVFIFSAFALFGCYTSPSSTRTQIVSRICLYTPWLVPVIVLSVLTASVAF
jgi:hypothetical protein